jgi:methyl-accepting chemotaxis protein
MNSAIGLTSNSARLQTTWPWRCRQQDSVTQEIARNAGAAAKGTRDVSENITEVSNSAMKTGQVASTVLTAAAELAEQSHQLRKEVERYLAQVRVAS